MKPDQASAVAIVEMDGGNRHLYNGIASRFEITGRLSVRVEDGTWSFVIEHLNPPYEQKEYRDDPLPRGECGVFFAMVGDYCVGQVSVAPFWNGMARVEDIRVAEEARRKGVGRRLMDTAVRWAVDRGFGILCLETQSNNAAACRFYSRYGFSLKGADTAVYDATENRGETALYWYLPLER